VSLQSYVPEEMAPLSGGVWRTRLLAQDLDVSADRLSGLTGELIVYPRARLLTLDLPLAGKLPLNQEEGGFRASLKSVKREQNSLAIAVDLEWPETVQITRPNPEAPEGISVLTRQGAALTVRSQSVNVAHHDGMQTQQYQFVFQTPADAPATCRVEVIVRSGTPQTLSFTFPDLALPDALTAEMNPPPKKPVAQRIPEDHPFYAPAGGGTLRLALPSGGGALRLGLSRHQAGGFGPWRWLDLEPGAGAILLLDHLRPGRYRVSATRGTAPAAAPAGPVQEALIEAGAVASPAPSAGDRR
jgi:hypothetical protein